MNDLFSVITGMITHSYILVIGTGIILLPAKILFRGFFGKRPI